MQQGHRQRAPRGVRPLGVVPLDKEQVAAVRRRGSLVLIVQPLKRQPVKLIANIILNGFRELLVLPVSRCNLGRGNVARYFRLDDLRYHVPRHYCVLRFLVLAVHLVDLVCASVYFFPLDHQIQFVLVLAPCLAQPVLPLLQNRLVALARFIKRILHFITSFSKRIAPFRD